MNNTLSRILMFFAGFILAFGSALSTMPGGSELTLGQILSVPLLVWVLSLSAGVISAIDGKILNRKQQP